MHLPAFRPARGRACCSRSSASFHVAVAIAIAVAVALAASAAPASARAAPRSPPAAAANLQRGVSLGLFSEDAGFSYRPLLDEIRATGADHVELVVPWYLADVRASAIHDHARFTPPPATITRAIADAHAAGLRVLLFPILRLEQQGSPAEWRGTLDPADRAALRASYIARIAALARLAHQGRVEVLSVGSELSTLDVDRAFFEPVVAAVRRVFHGALTYSGNWDHFEQVAIYDLVDYAGLCGYFKLSEGPTTDVEQLTAAWRAVRVRMEAVRARVGRPLLLAEVGYLSQAGASAWPWNEGATERIDLADQARCYQAFRRVWQDASPSLLAGVYFWNWYGWGGDRSRGYTPRGKPAADEIRAFFTASPATK